MYPTYQITKFCCELTCQLVSEQRMSFIEVKVSAGKKLLIMFQSDNLRLEQMVAGIRIVLRWNRGSSFAIVDRVAYGCRCRLIWSLKAVQTIPTAWSGSPMSKCRCKELRQQTLGPTALSFVKNLWTWMRSLHLGTTTSPTKKNQKGVRSISGWSLLRLCDFRWEDGYLGDVFHNRGDAAKRIKNIQRKNAKMILRQHGGKIVSAELTLMA